MTIEGVYNLRVQLDDGRTIALTVADSENVTKESLDMLIDKGTRIAFHQGNQIGVVAVGSRRVIDEQEIYFKSDTVAGTKKANRIKILNE